MNSKNFIKLFQSSQSFTTSRLDNLFNTFTSLNKYSLNISLSSWQTILLLIIILLSSLMILFKSKSQIKIFFIFFLTCFLGISIYSGPKYAHYLGFLYPFYFILIGYFLAKYPKIFFGKIVTAIFMILFIF